MGWVLDIVPITRSTSTISEQRNHRVGQRPADQIGLYPAWTAATKCVYRTLQQNAPIAL